MMDLGCYCISALRNLANEEPRCTSALPDKWAEDLEIDLGMSADLVYPSGATAHFDCSFVGGDKAGPVVVTVTGSKGTLTIEGYNGGGNRANALTLKIGDAEPTVRAAASAGLRLLLPPHPPRWYTRSIRLANRLIFLAWWLRVGRNGRQSPEQPVYDVLSALRVRRRG